VLSWAFFIEVSLLCECCFLILCCFYFDTVAWRMSRDDIVGEEVKYVLRCEISTSVEYGGIFFRLVKY